MENNSTGVSVPSDNSLPLLWPAAWHITKDCQKSSSSFHQSPSVHSLIRTSPCLLAQTQKKTEQSSNSAWTKIVLNSLVQKLLLSTHPLFQILTHSLFPDFPHPSMVLKSLVDSKIFWLLHWFCVFFQTQHLLAYGILPIKLWLIDGTSNFCYLAGIRLAKSIFLLGNPRTWLFTSLHWTRVAWLY